MLSAEKEDECAQFMVGLCYQKGYGVIKDNTQAALYFVMSYLNPKTEERGLHPLFTKHIQEAKLERYTYPSERDREIFKVMQLYADAILCSSRVGYFFQKMFEFRSERGIGTLTKTSSSMEKDIVNPFWVPIWHRRLVCQGTARKS